MTTRRERYEAANIRGGLGVRKRLSEESFRPTYRLNGVQRGATIAECLDKYGRWEGGYRLGVLVRKTAHWVHVKWDDEDDIATIEQGEARYMVDRGKWQITNPRLGSPLGAERGASTLALAENSLEQSSKPALTGHTAPDRFRHRQNAGSTDRGDEDMERQSNAALEREAAKKALTNGDLKDRETYTAKQVATRCGTDAKTMRKFFRSSHSTVEAVGQGGRYEFAAADLPQIKKEFDSWSNRGKKNSTPSKPAPKKQSDDAGMAAAIQGAVDEGVFEEDENDSPWEPHPDLRDADPTDEDIDAIEDIDIDLDDLDAEEI